MITDAEFSKAGRASLEFLNRALDAVAETYDVEILYQGGVLTIEIEDPAPSKIVISPNSPARQIWISAQSTSFKLDWSEDREEFIWSSSGESLDRLVGRLVGEELGAGPIEL